MTNLIAFPAFASHSNIPQNAARCWCVGVDDPARQHLPHGSIPHTAGEGTDGIDRPPLFARAMQTSPVKSEPGDLQPIPSDDSRKPVTSDAAANSRPGSKHGGDADALISGADADVSATSEPLASVRGGDAAAASDLEARPSKAEIDGGSIPEQQRVELAQRKGHAKAGAKRKHGNEPRNGEAAGRPAKAARVAAPALNGKVGMYAGSQRSASNMGCVS